MNLTRRAILSSAIGIPLAAPAEPFRWDHIIEPVRPPSAKFAGFDPALGPDLSFLITGELVVVDGQLKIVGIERTKL